MTEALKNTPPANKSTATGDLKQMANALRFLAIDAVNQAESGHPGMPMGMADIAAILFAEYMNFNPKDPNWPNRDRFILSNGHGSMLQYGLLHLLGYNVSMGDIKNFRQLGSNTPGHPEYGHTEGVETTTGPLGQGFATATGMALGQKIMAARHGNELFNNKTYVAVGDGCLMEGISHEAAELAGQMKLSGLVALFDSNGITIDGKTDLATSADIPARFKAYGWAVREADGHNHDDIRAALDWAQNQDKPAFIEFKTHIGYGSRNMQDTAKAHGSPLGADEAANVRKELGWKKPPFEVPDAVYADWQKATEHGQRHYQNWQKTWQALDDDKRDAIQGTLERKTTKESQQALLEVKKKAIKEQPKIATRKASGACIDAFAPFELSFVSGSADLTGSNNTKPENSKAISAAGYNGNYIHYGVREHGMAATMNGMSLYGGIRPASGTFLVFTDYLRPGLRLSALMNQPVVYVMTHDSIGLGEDGPTHQPIEHLAMLRATPNVITWRPADLPETAECWQAILNETSRPSVIALSRQGLPTLREEYSEENLCAKGAYILRKEAGKLDGIFLASGSEVHLAIEAHEALEKEGIHTRVVSVPSMETFLAQSADYKESILPKATQTRVVIEAASAFGWQALAPEGAFVCMEGFGASAPAPELYKEFGITAENAVTTMKKQLNK